MVEIFKKNIMILGEGASGKAAFAALKNIAHPFFYDAKKRFCSDDESLFSEPKKSPDIIVTSPGIGSHPMFEYAKQHNIPLICELELGFLLNDTPIIAITGTNGKTTVTKMIGDMLSKKYKVAVCGNIGLPFSSIAGGDHDIAVVEASSFQLERCVHFKPHIAVITNITQDHLDRHGSMQNYIDIKMSISKNQQREDYFIVPSDLKKHLPQHKSRLIFSDIDAYINCGWIEVEGEKVARVDSIKIEGEHNKKNIMQAMLVAKLMGLSNEDIEAAIKGFVMERHRLELIKETKGKRWYDDSKATNIDACIVACESMTGDTALILGGSDKGYNYDELFVRLPKQIKVVYLMGQVRSKLVFASEKARHEILIEQVGMMSEAVSAAKNLKLDNVLLSPAAASFDRYKDYKERGEEFRKLVESL